LFAITITNKNRKKIPAILKKFKLKQKTNQSERECKLCQTTKKHRNKNDKKREKTRDIKKICIYKIDISDENFKRQIDF